jgi:cytochrome P450
MASMLLLLRASPSLTTSTTVTPPLARPHFHQTFVPLLAGTLQGKAHRVATGFMETYGENYEVRFPLPWTRWCFLHEPVMIKALLNEVNPPKSPEFCRGIDAVAKGSMLTAPWEEWLVQRRTTSPALSQKLVGSWSPIFEEASAPLLERLEAASESQQEVELDEALVKVFLAIISRITLGRYLSERQATELMGGITDALDEGMRRILLPPGGRFVTAVLPVGRRYRRARRSMQELVRSCVSERRATRAAADGAGAASGDLLDLLLDAEAAGAMSDTEVDGQLLTFILAGHDTTAHTLSWMLYEVAAQPALQTALQAECDEALPDRGHFPSAATLRSLPLLDRVWREALRKHPVAATGTLRRLSADCTLTGGDGEELTLRKGTTVSVVPFSLHRNPKHWESPVEAFDPDRFLPQALEARHPFAYQPFSGGPRDCIGKGLARAEALSVAAAMIRRFDFQLAGRAAEAAAAGAAPRDHHMITRKPLDGIAVRVSRRR